MVGALNIKTERGQQRGGSTAVSLIILLLISDFFAFTI